ncbi:hypothetical protein ACIRJS_16650 [Streptomyces sp. NPDC102340]|uniref:hypothetical protein n=1 Tax=unclassified Streptomyces TaxID=2593676 RepID=UPI003821E3F1
MPEPITPKPQHAVLGCAHCSGTDGPFVQHTFGPAGTLCEPCAEAAGPTPWLSVDEIERTFADCRTDGARTVAFLHLARRAITDALDQAELADTEDLLAHRDLIVSELDAVQRRLFTVMRELHRDAFEGTTTR